MDDFLAHTSRWRTTLLALSSAAFVALGLWMAGAFGPVPEFRRYPAIFVSGLGWVSVILFGFFRVVWVKKLFDAPEQLRIGQTGVRSARWSDATIPWSEIIDVTAWSFNGQKAIILHLRDPARFPGRGLTAVFAKTNRSLMRGDIAISLTGTDRRFDEAMAAIARFRSSSPPLRRV